MFPPDAFERLRDRVQVAGGFVHPALSRQTADGLAGIFTQESLAPNTRLLMLPPSLIMGPHLYAGPYDLSHDRDRTVYAFLSEFAKGAQSRFEEWFACLPPLAEFEASHPVFADEGDLHELEHLNPRIPHTIANFRARILELHQKIDGAFSVEDVCWASLIYLTRAFDGTGLVPVADFFNHCPARGRGLVAGHELRTGLTVAAGEEVFISYGKNLDTLDVWLNFGFVDPQTGPVINCANIRGRTPLGADCYIDESGISSGLRRSGVNLRLLRQALRAEVGAPFESTRPRVALAQKIMLGRRALLERDEMWERR